MNYDTSLLFYFVKDALSQYSEDFRIEDKVSPIIFTLNQRRFSAHISFVHDSGNARGNADEVRIQLSRAAINKQLERKDQGYEIAFLGFFEDGNSFVAWEPEYIVSLSSSSVVSVYARHSQQQTAKENYAGMHQIPARNLKRESRAISMQSTSLGIYLENMISFHSLPNLLQIQDILKKAADGEFNKLRGNVYEDFVNNNAERVKFSYQHKSYPRDPKFVKLVMEAYNNACCICKKQLRIIQAAHIIPHSVPNCTDTINNGLALCVEHHKLYDDGLLIPRANRKIFLNENRVEFLKSINQTQGLESLREISKYEYFIPEESGKQPSNEYLERGLRIRIGEDSFENNS